MVNKSALLSICPSYLSRSRVHTTSFSWHHAVQSRVLHVYISCWRRLTGSRKHRCGDTRTASHRRRIKLIRKRWRNRNRQTIVNVKQCTKRIRCEVWAHKGESLREWMTPRNASHRLSTGPSFQPAVALHFEQQCTLALCTVSLSCVLPRNSLIRCKLSSGSKLRYNPTFCVMKSFEVNYRRWHENIRLVFLRFLWDKFNLPN